LFSNPDDETLRALLETSRRIAIVGLSPKPWRDSNGIGRFLMERGYDVFPVYPRETEILGRRVYRSVAEIPDGVDLVDVFRRGEFLPGVVEDALAARAPAVWFQLGCVNEAAARRAAEAGMTVVMDRCIRVDLGRLFRRTDPHG
jgi:predicted CoA-binding protein